VKKQELLDMMTRILQGALDEQRQEEGNDSPHVQATADLPLIGDGAAITSIGLVSFISDVESTIEEAHGFTLVLVNEQALSRKRSPFRTIDTLSDYVLELAAVPAEP
jgi:hypothetical protein